MQLSDFSFELPEHLIAQHPLPRRSASRLLVLDGQNGQISHAVFSDLPHRLRAGDLLVVNDTRVIPARLFGRKVSGGKIEVMLERVLGADSLLARIRASKAPKPGALLQIGDITARVQGREGEFFILALPPEVDIEALFSEHGHTPLPPYIDRAADEADAERYQTVYGVHPGAVAAPTAGLHFDQALLEQLAARGIASASITLHVGAGTFQPIREADPAQHQMHAERVEVAQSTVDQIQAVRARGGRVVAVGTTTVRALESAAISGELRAFNGDTRLFITPGTGFRVVDALISNFHLPRSTLLMLVSAFAGHRQLMHAYAEAIRLQYRFYSYGDAMLLWPDRASWHTMSTQI